MIVNNYSNGNNNNRYPVIHSCVLHFVNTKAKAQGNPNVTHCYNASERQIQSFYLGSLSSESFLLCDFKE